MPKQFDKGKQPYDAAKDTQATAPSPKTIDFVRLSAESAREHSRTTEDSRKVTQATDGYSKGSIHEQQREQQQRELRQKATGGWHPQNLSHPIPEQRLLGGVLTDSQKTSTAFLNPEERKARSEYSNGINTEKSRMSNSLYSKVYNKINSRKPYSETDIIDFLNQIRQSPEYISVFAESSQQPRETQSSRQEGQDFLQKLEPDKKQAFKNFINFKNRSISLGDANPTELARQQYPLGYDLFNEYARISRRRSKGEISTEEDSHWTDAIYEEWNDL
jgi:hypothetical protein